MWIAIYKAMPLCTEIMNELIEVLLFSLYPFSVLLFVFSLNYLISLFLSFLFHGCQLETIDSKPRVLTQCNALLPLTGVTREQSLGLLTCPVIYEG